ncbi:MAG: pilus assembly protein PilX [Gammaproteobacteria bacterium]|nr:pilus assembly protein PilX [Gammaproteobacteria bacterium]
MRNFKAIQKQRGAVLVIALVMLLVLTVLAVSNMRGVALESRITASRAEAQRLGDAADAALREGEFRFYGPANLRDKLEFNAANCKTTNKLQTNGLNKPCLLKEIDDTADIKKMFDDPIAYLGGSDSTASGGALNWMPYLGLDASGSKDYEAEDKRESFWNTYLISASASESEAVNAEYGAILEGRGTYYYLVNGQANDELTVQSTIANIYLGLNN